MSNPIAKSPFGNNDSALARSLEKFANVNNSEEYTEIKNAFLKEFIEGIDSRDWGNIRNQAEDEDEDDNFKIKVTISALKGVEVTISEDGEKAIKAARKTHEKFAKKIVKFYEDYIKLESAVQNDPKLQDLRLQNIEGNLALDASEFPVKLRGMVTSVNVDMGKIIKNLKTFLPAGTAAETKAGYSKYHLLIEMVRTDFSLYDILESKILPSLMNFKAEFLTEESAKQLLSELNNLKTQLNRFTSVLSDMGMTTLADKAHDFRKKSVEIHSRGSSQIKAHEILDIHEFLRVSGIDIKEKKSEPVEFESPILKKESEEKKRSLRSYDEISNIGESAIDSREQEKASSKASSSSVSSSSISSSSKSSSSSDSSSSEEVVTSSDEEEARRIEELKRRKGEEEKERVRQEQEEKDRLEKVAQQEKEEQARKKQEEEQEDSGDEVEVTAPLLSISSDATSSSEESEEVVTRKRKVSRTPMFSKGTRDCCWKMLLLLITVLILFMVQYVCDNGADLWSNRGSLTDRWKNPNEYKDAKNSSAKNTGPKKNESRDIAALGALVSKDSDSEYSDSEYSDYYSDYSDYDEDEDLDDEDDCCCPIDKRGEIADDDETAGCCDRARRLWFLKRKQQGGKLMQAGK